MYMIGEFCNMEGDEMNKTIKTISIILISMILVLGIPLYSKALSFDDILTAGDDFLKDGDGSLTVTPDSNDLQTISKTVSNVLLTIALGVTLISAVIMGINFTIQSVEDKAKIKESMIPWVIGIFVSFGAYAIWRITMNVFYNL